MKPASPPYITTMQSATIVHISDIHIGSNPSRKDEYSKVFSTLADEVAAIKPTAIVITGDIFHHKNRYSGDDVALFRELLDAPSFKASHIVIIPGNHDISLTSEELDLISPITPDYPNVTYKKESGPFTVAGIDFYHVSITSTTTPQPSELTNRVLLYHGLVNGATFGSFTATAERITAAHLNSAKCALLGDIHQHQIIGTNAAYAGSLIQQNFGEDTNKGYLIWHLTATTPSIERRIIRSTSTFVKLDLRGLTPTEVSSRMQTFNTPHNRISVIIDNDEQLDAANAIKPIDKVSRVAPSSSTNSSDPVTDQLETLREMLAEFKLTSQQVDDIIKSHFGRISTAKVAKWHINSAQWHNMYKYESGHIDFDILAKNPGISGVIAGNMSGKSSIFDIIVWGLFGKNLRGDKRSMVRFGCTNASTTIIFTCNDVKYRAERKELNKSKSTLTLHQLPPPNGVNTNGVNTDVPLRFASSTEVNLTAKTIDQTYQVISSLIGSHEQFLATGLYYDGINDVAKMNNAERRRVFPELFGMTDSTPLVRDLKAKIKVITTRIASIPRPRTTAEPHPQLQQLKQEERILNKQIDDMIPILYTARATLQHNEALQARYNSIINQMSSLTSSLSPDNKEAEACAKPTQPLTTSIINLSKSSYEPSATIQSLIDEVPHHLRSTHGNEASSTRVPSQMHETSSTRVPSQMHEASSTRVPSNKEEIAEALKRVRANIESHKGTITGDIDAMRYIPSCDCCSHNLSLINNSQHLSTLVREEKRLSLLLENADKVNIAPLLERLEHSKKVEEALKLIEQHHKWRLYEAHLAQRDKITEIKLLEKQLNEIGDINTIKKAIRRASSILKDEAMLTTLRQEHLKMSADILVLQQEAEIWKNYHAEVPQLEEELKKVSAYLSCVADEKLIIAMVRKNTKRIIDSVNDVLSSMSNFTIENDDDLFQSIYILSPSPRNTRLPLSMGSGFQKFIISIAFRIAFTTNLYNAPQFLCIDEGFGVMDENNTSKLSDLFAVIRQNFRFVFIITHIAELQSVIKNPLRIIDNTINNTPSPNAPTTLTASAALTLAKSPLEMLRDIMSGGGTSSSNSTAEVTCTCGSVVKARSMPSHLKSKKHIASINK